MKRRHAHAVVTAADRKEQERREDEARQKKLYGDALPAVLLLRRRGFVVTRERGDQVMVDNKLMTMDELKALAAREGGLAGIASPVRSVTTTAGGLKVGAKVALVPKKATAPRPQPSSAPRLSGAAAAAKQRAQEHSTDLGPPPRIVWLDLALLSVDRRYQRDIGQAGTTHVHRILREFNWSRYQPIVVAEKGEGKFVVIDGQHRLEAAKKHPLIDSLPCYIVEAADVAAQAAIFAAVNSRRLGLTSLQKFWAAVAAGEDGAVTVHKVCRAWSVEILRTPPSYDIPARSIVGPFTLLKVLRQLGKAPLTTAIGLLAETHGKTINAFRSPTIVALARIAAGSEFGARRMTETLKALDLGKFYDEMRQERVTGGGTLESAAERVLQRHYKPDLARAA